MFCVLFSAPVCLKFIRVNSANFSNDISQLPYFFLLFVFRYRNYWSKTVTLLETISDPSSPPQSSIWVEVKGKHFLLPEMAYLFIYFGNKNIYAGKYYTSDICQAGKGQTWVGSQRLNDPEHNRAQMLCASNSGLRLFWQIVISDVKWQIVHRVVYPNHLKKDEDNNHHNVRSKDIIRDMLWCVLELFTGRVSDPSKWLTFQDCSDLKLYNRYLTNSFIRILSNKHKHCYTYMHNMCITCLYIGGGKCPFYMIFPRICSLEFRLK